MSTSDATRFRDLWARLGGRGDTAATLAQLVAAYSQPQRSYHNLRHIHDCLQQLDLAIAAGVDCPRPDEVEAGIWFHDAVYDSHAADNERQSADWALRNLTRAGVDQDVAQRVAALIEATRHDCQPDSPESRLLLDIDLSILGREPAVFAEYDRQIRAEYGWVPQEAYREGRAKILAGFLTRPAIYQTAHFRERYERQARLNVAAAIGALRGPAA